MIGIIGVAVAVIGHPDDYILVTRRYRTSSSVVVEVVVAGVGAELFFGVIVEWARNVLKRLDGCLVWQHACHL